jgi:hypothetical protein
VAQGDGDRGGSGDTRDRGLLGVLARRSFGEDVWKREDQQAVGRVLRRKRGRKRTA